MYCKVVMNTKKSINRLAKKKVAKAFTKLMYKRTLKNKYIIVKSIVAT